MTITPKELIDAGAWRHLDSVIAEKVFGWQYHSGSTWLVPHRDSFASAPNGPPPYSTEIASAWTLVEEMQRRGVYIDVRPRRVGFGAVVGTAGADDEDIWLEEHVEADTAPAVICLAALSELAQQKGACPHSLA